MRAIISVVGQDRVGILNRVSGACAECNANIVDVTQSVLQNMFVMVMLVDITDIRVDFDALTKKMSALGEEIGMVIHVMHEDIFNSMHRI
ncbi:MAG: ACT domain-containing protein [Clostridia bacterium]|jgi:ACT domain-containing protein|nr:ACT domain-containing protein [Clostridia bacterium]